jgi:hypothetical protein
LSDEGWAEFTTNRVADAALIISDAIDGVIHNAARRGMLGDPIVQSELVRLVSLYLVVGIEPTLLSEPDF